jgi:YesN/AraC family two-component response regulator
MKYQVLLVEDEPITGHALKQALASETLDGQGIEVTLAQDGRAAIGAIVPGKFDLVVLDLKLPHITGEEVLAAMRKIDPYIDVVVYTNYQDPPVMKKLINLGVSGYINKGADADLWATVEKIKSRLSPVSDTERKALLDGTGLSQ